MNAAATLLWAVAAVGATFVSAWLIRWQLKTSRVRRLTRLGEQQLARQDPQSAFASFEQALVLAPDRTALHMGRGLALLSLQRFDDALLSFEHALRKEPDIAEAHYRRGNALLRLGRSTEAVACYERALQLEPGFVDALYNQGLALQGLKRSKEAIGRYDRVLEINPDDAEALNNRGNAWADLKRPERALASYNRAVELRPDLADGLHNQGVALQELKRPADAVRSFEKLVSLAPDYPFAKGKLLHAKMLSCDWRGLTTLRDAVDVDVRLGKKAIEPFGYLGLARHADDLKRCAETYSEDYRPVGPATLPPAAPATDNRIRIGYLSGEFRHQATSLLMAQLFELSDRRRFRQFAFDNGFDDGSATRQRLAAAFDEIVDISRLADDAAASAIRHRGIDILVDLSGYFGFARPGVLALRPAPIQVNYLGFPGTLGSPWIDYVLADVHVIPPDHREHHTEQVVYLPDCYQANDTTRTVPNESPSRAELGLPAHGFVFCCFNNNFKITPEVFEVWMRLLNALENSVLWLLEDNPEAVENLRGEAQQRGVSSHRIVFAKRLPLAQHLARHRQADLFLDTLPCNAHTTASDALWAGLPLLTCMGPTFPGRVAGSLLLALDLPELVTSSLEAYEAQALMLARSPDRLQNLRARLAAHLTTHAPFNTQRLSRSIEAAYETIWARYERGEVPQGFAVPPGQAGPPNCQ